MALCSLLQQPEGSLSSCHSSAYQCIGGDISATTVNREKPSFTSAKWKHLQQVNFSGDWPQPKVDPHFTVIDLARRPSSGLPNHIRIVSSQPTLFRNVNPIFTTSALSWKERFNFQNINVRKFYYYLFCQKVIKINPKVNFHLPIYFGGSVKFQSNTKVRLIILHNPSDVWQAFKW